jgi:hypothetical protein
LMGGDPQLGLRRFIFGVKHGNSLPDHDLLSSVFLGILQQSVRERELLRVHR